jgi:hypothetical protein
MVLFCIPCLALLAYFGVASIFFPKYRVYMKEGWRCFIDKLKRKKCSVSFDNRMRIALSSWLTKRGLVKLGRFFNNERNFNMTLTIFVVGSTILTVYLLLLYIQFWFNPPCTDNTCSI